MPKVNAIEIDHKHKRQFKRAVDSLNKILEEVQTYHPEAFYNIDGDDMQLLTEPSKRNDKRQKNIAARGSLVGADDKYAN